MGVLREIFGPSKKEIWSQIAVDIDGEFLDRGFWKTDVVVYQHREWQLVLDSFFRSTGKSQIPYTRMRAPFINKDRLYLKMYRETFFSSIGKAFGMQDITIGDEYFDRKFVIQGNKEEKIKHLLYEPKLKQLFDIQPKVYVEIKNDDGLFGTSFPAGVDQLYFECLGIIKDLKNLYHLFELFSLLLERLVKIDSAYEDDPNVSLI